MSSALYEVRVLSVEDNEVSLQLTIVDPEEKYLPKESNFAIQAVIEAWDMAMHGDFDPDLNDVSEEEFREAAEDSPFFKQFSRWVSYLYGGEEEITKGEFLDIEKHYVDERHRFPSNLGSWREEDGKYFMELDSDERAIQGVADDQILSCSLSNVTEDDDGNKTGTMNFMVDDEKMIEHMLPGTVWETDRYDL